MADIPEKRSSDAASFTYVGVDVFGPFVSKEDKKWVQALWCYFYMPC